MYSDRLQEESPVQIRPYRVADAAATLVVFLAAVKVTARADYTPEQVRVWAREDQRELESWNRAMVDRDSFVAVVAGEVVGFSDVAKDGYIDMLFVAPAFGGKGVAKLLLGEAEKRARDGHTSQLSANVSITARPVFERCGFEIVRAQQPVIAGVMLDNFHMRKLLP